jgi:tetratricopeptide (TPR) repeat protein
MNLRIYKLAALALCLPVIAPGQAATPAQAIALEQQGKLPEAAAAWRAVTRQNPRDAAAFASLGVVLSKQQKYPEAASAYHKALALNPRLPGVQLNLGLAEFKRGNFSAAIPPFSAVLAGDPSNLQARTLLGLSYYGLKRFPEAAKHLELAVAADPDNAEMRRVLAQSCLWAKQYACAQEQFREMLQRAPDSAVVHIFMGEALDGLDRTPEAISELQTAARLAPTEPNVHFGLGYLYWKSQKLDDAEQEFKAELAQDATHAQAMAYLGDIEMKRGNAEGALPLLRKAVQLRSDLRIAHMDLGTILAQQKQYPEAAAAFRRAVDLDPKQSDAHFRLANLYKAMGNSAAAEKEFAAVRQLQENPADDMVHTMPAAPPSLEGESKPPSR